MAAFLVSQGLNAIGIDVSPTMLVEARRAHPDIAFAEGCLDDLPFMAAELSGAVCWYSIIHTPAERLVDAFGELNRVLKPGLAQSPTVRPVTRACLLSAPGYAPQTPPGVKYQASKTCSSKAMTRVGT